MDFDSTETDALVEVSQEQVVHLYEKIGLNLWGNVIIAIILATMLFLQSYPTTGQTLYLVVGFGLILVASFYKLMVSNKFQQERHFDQEKIDYWVNQYVNTSTLINFIWGSIGIIFFPENILYQGLLFLSLFSVLLTSVPLLVLSRATYYLQMIIVLLPISLYVIWMGGKEHYMITAAFFVASISLFTAANYIYELLFELQTTQAELLQQANTDQLTKISNRRQYDQTLKIEWRRCLRDTLPVSMLSIDVDYFKKYNDRFGHAQGDEALCTIASCLKNITRRPGDIAARYGGEEFAILLPSTTLENAMMLAERLRVNIERFDIKHPDSEYKVLTVSIGVSSCEPKQCSDMEGDMVYPAMLMNSADNAMYLAKRQGRNRIAHQGCGEQKIANILHQEAVKDAKRAQRTEKTQPA